MILFEAQLINTPFNWFANFLLAFTPIKLFATVLFDDCDSMVIPLPRLLPIVFGPVGAELPTCCYIPDIDQYQDEHHLNDYQMDFQHYLLNCH